MVKDIRNNDDKFVFHRHDEIGAAAAEDDSLFLSDCFVDTGDLASLKECRNPKRIIVGRTGAGKSALLSELEKECSNVIKLSPHSLSLNYVANNHLISFFEEAGVNLSIFYSLLWKHILVVELLKKKFNIKDEASQKNYMRHIRSIVYKKDRIKEIAVDYFETWGNKFWLTTEQRMHELTERVENKLAAALSGSSLGVDASIEVARSLSTEAKKEFIDRGQKAVSEVQVRELENMITVLADDIFNDHQEHYYITIDTLDEEWADDRIKYKLIKSLMDTVRRFRKIDNVKVIIALRQDLLDKVLHSSHELGFQEEKYESLYLELRWNAKALTDLIDKRVQFLVKRRYTKDLVSSKDILPATVDGESPLDYIFSRTFNRPRDVILFINQCIDRAEDHAAITANNIKKAEEEYSYKRLQSLATEWLTVYPNLEQILMLFHGVKDHFPVSDITENFLLERFTDVSDQILDMTKDPIVRLLNKLFSEESSNFNSIRNTLLRELFITGFIGIKSSPSSTTKWSTDTRLSIAPGQLKPSSLIFIHPMFFRGLDIDVSVNKKLIK